MACSPELQALWKHFHDLQCSIHHPEQLAEQLAVEASAVNLVPTDVKEQICNDGGTVAEKSRLLILRIEQGVASNPVAFHFFLTIISKHASLATIAGQLRTTYAQQMLAAGIQDEPSSLFRDEENASNSNDVRPCLSADSSTSVQRFVPPSGTSQVGGQNPSQQSTSGNQSVVAPSQLLQQGTSSDALKISILCDELSTVSNWYQLGLKLDVPDYKLDEIQRNHPFEGCSRWKLEALKLWLQLTPNASWLNIVRALQQIGERTLAKSIRHKFLRRGSSTSPARSPLVSPSPVFPPSHQPTQAQYGNPVEALAESVRAIYRCRPEVNADCWPPVKKSQYINLALIENESMDFGNEFLRYTLRGSVDDIMKSKNEITYCSLFENMVVGARILFEGRPGSGKTTLLNKISRDWAQGVILNSLVSLLILVPLRQLAGKTEVTLETLLSFIPDDKAQELGQHIRSIGGDGICFALDGLDEYSITKGRSDFIFELIKRNCLPRSVVIVASRPAASQKFRRHADQSIEVLGFLRPQIKQFILEYYAPNEELAKELQLYLDHHPNVLHMCYLPVHTTIVTFLFSALGAKLPETETEIYKQFTLQTLIRTQLKAEVEVDTNVTLESFEDLNPEQYQLFCCICELALSATINRKQAFTHKEVKDFVSLQSGCETNKSLGLITVDRQLMLCGPTNTYSFLHLTFQEFLAACHLTTLNEEKQYELVLSYHKKAHMQVVCKFFCGLTKLRTDGALKSFQSIISGAPPCTLLHLHCTYESQSEVACQTLNSACNGVLCLKKETINPSDSSAIGFIIANTGVKLHGIDLDSCNVGQESLATLAELNLSDLCNLKTLSLSGTKINDPTAAKFLTCFMEKAEELSLLKLDRCGVQMKTFLEITPSLSKLSRLEVLSIHHNSLAVQCGKYLRDALKSMQHLKELDIDIDVLKMFGVYELYKHCKSLKTVRVWRKQLFAEVSVSSSDEAVMRLYDVILERGYLSLRELGVVLQKSSFSKLQFKREMSVDAGRETDSLDGVKIDLLYFEHSCRTQQDLAALRAFAGVTLLSSLLKAFTDTTVLNLVGNSIGDKGVSELASVLKECQKLKELNLADNNIGEEGLSILVSVLKECQELKELNMDFITIPSGGGILQLLQTIPTVELIRCCGVKLALEVSNEFGKVTAARILKRESETVLVSVQIDQTPTYDINLFGCGLHEPDIQVVAELVKLCPKAQNINLANNNIGDEGLSILVSVLKECQELKELNLANNNIGEEGLSILVSVLKECQELKELNLGWNNIQDAGCAALSAALQECKELQKLDLSWNNLTDASVVPLTELIKTSKSLKELR